MKLTIVGSGCKTCQALEQHAKVAVEELSMTVEFDKFTDKLGFADLGVLRTPAIMVNDDVLSQGRLLSVQEIKELLIKFDNA
jgi:small redox-active disulfide protein 2